ncbi:site-specific integrase [Leucobacter luti]|uniref:Site-specific recombinase XerD n=1 Tax=Leucobacter luti TaxID=340320 RepID=A0A4V6MD45_9MICO|nr:site-specific integrase [Leucobacter luti]MBL3699280.1 site-specific integrase [Leucobacter luti]RZT66789.1 site-specific recombinase XerD [Leucobacter luti]
MAGSITTYSTTAGSRYRVRYRKPNGAQTDKRGFKTKRDATAFLASVEVGKSKGAYLDPTEGKRTVADFAESWIDGHLSTLKASSQNVMETAWRVHVEPEWGTRGVASIRPSEVSAWLGRLTKGNDKKKGLAAQTVRRCAFVLSLILDRAVQDGAVHSNAARGVRLPAKTRKPVVYLTHQQVELLATESTQPDLVRLLAYTGLRWGEAAALRVKHLELPKSRIRIEDNVVKVKGENKFGTPKSGASRIVPIPDFVSFSLRRLAKGRPQKAFVFGTDTDPIPRPNADYSWFAGAVRTSMSKDDTFPRVTPHDLRHTAASLAVSAGANVKAVQRMLGHASAAMTLDVYADLFDDDLDEVAARLSESRAAALEIKCGQNVGTDEKTPVGRSATAN